MRAFKFDKTMRNSALRQFEARFVYFVVIEIVESSRRVKPERNILRHVSAKPSAASDHTGDSAVRSPSQGQPRASGKARRISSRIVDRQPLMRIGQHPFERLFYRSDWSVLRIVRSHHDHARLLRRLR